MKPALHEANQKNVQSYRHADSSLSSILTQP